MKARCKRNNHKVIISGRQIKVDDCLAGIICLVNSSPFHKTLGSCCGHGIYHQTLIVTDRSGIIWEAFSGKRIPRKRKFYRLDSNGFYYIPEIDKPRKRWTQ